MSNNNYPGGYDNDSTYYGGFEDQQQPKQPPYGQQPQQQQWQQQPQQPYGAQQQWQQQPQQPYGAQQQQWQQQQPYGTQQQQQWQQQQPYGAQQQQQQWQQQPYGQPPYGPQQPKQSKGMAGTIIAVIIGLAVAATVGWVVYINVADKKSDSDTTMLASNIDNADTEIDESKLGPDEYTDGYIIFTAPKGATLDVRGNKNEAFQFSNETNDAIAEYVISGDECESTFDEADFKELARGCRNEALKNMEGWNSMVLSTKSKVNGDTKHFRQDIKLTKGGAEARMSIITVRSFKKPVQGSVVVIHSSNIDPMIEDVANSIRFSN